MASAPDSKTAWTSLHTTFTNKSQTRIFSLRNQHGKISKDTRPNTEYLMDIRNIADELSTDGSPVTNDELVIKILSGLDTEYHSISSAIRTRQMPISYEDLYEQLLDHKLLLKLFEVKQISTTPITAAVAQRENSSNDNRFQRCNNYTSSDRYPMQSNYQS